MFFFFFLNLHKTDIKFEIIQMVKVARFISVDPLLDLSKKRRENILQNVRLNRAFNALWERSWCTHTIELSTYKLFATMIYV